MCFIIGGMLKAQELYRKIPFMKETGRLLIAFLTAGGIGDCDAVGIGEVVRA